MAIDVKLLREFSKLNQSEFWNRIGVTQSGGSRYETHQRRIPKPVLQLLRLMYVERVNLESIKRPDVELIEYLQSEEQDLYDTLKKKAKEWRRRRPTTTL